MNIGPFERFYNRLGLAVAFLTSHGGGTNDQVNDLGILSGLLGRVVETIIGEPFDKMGKTI
jgi:hypothetical protein